MASVDTSILTQGSFVDVKVSTSTQTATKNLKVCRIKTRSVLFIEIDRANKKNIFRKVNNGDIEYCTESVVSLKTGKLPKKWESAWDSIGSTPTRTYGRRCFSNHSKGWSSNAPQYRSTTNNNVSGFPMV